MKKGDIFKFRNQESFYKIVGYFGRDLVLAPMNENENQVLVYTQSEMKDFISTGYFSKLHKVNTK